MLESGISPLACSVCDGKGGLALGASALLRCEVCGHELRKNADGYFDLMDATVPAPAPSTRAQLLMESPLIVRWYEKLVRPQSVWMFAGSKAPVREGEFFLYRNALGISSHAGPWLDLSCGDGRFTLELASSKPDDLVIGLDLSPAMLKKAARDAKEQGNLIYLRGDVHRLPLHSNQLQGVVNAGALHIYDDPDRALGEVLRVLKPGGVYVCGDFATSKRPTGYLAQWFSQIKRYDPKELPGWFEELGFVGFEQALFGSAFFLKAHKQNTPAYSACSRNTEAAHEVQPDVRK